MNPSEPLNLEEIRKEIDSLDSKLLSLLSTRQKLAERVIESKDASAAPLRDEARERALLMQRISEGRELGLNPTHVTALFREVIAESIRNQQDYLQRKANGKTHLSPGQKIAFHGIDGSYSHLAGQAFFERTRKAEGTSGEQRRFIGHASFEAALRAVESGDCDYGIIPIENTTTGAINEVYDLLLNSRIAIVGEEKFSISHCLVATEAVPVAHLQRVHCSPLAVSECSQFLAGIPQCRVEYTNDSATAVKRVRELNDPLSAAIASEEAAEMFGLHVVQRGLGNHQESFTRYLIIAKQPIVVDQRIPSKTSIVIHTANKPGALVSALSIFKERGINLTKLESRPVPGNTWEEMFYLDFHGNVESEQVKQALADLTRSVRFIKVLGCYPACDIPPVEVPAEETQPRVAACAVETKDKPKATSSGKSAAYKLASREHKPSDTVIEVGGVKIGGGDFVVIAGPCSVESREQIMACAQHARAHGATILRGGVFKPRTSPYSFQGLGYEGLDLLVEAGRAHGLPVITEVMTTEDVDRVAQHADIIQIGARNMQNYSLLKAVGEIRRPVMLKRGMSAPVEEVLQAVEYILAGGNQQVFLCERGIRTFETATRGTLDISAVPVLKARTHLPVFIDPSHAAGTRDLVPPLALAAKAVGADGIIVEFHPEPERALSDGPQALLFTQFEKLMRDLKNMRTSA